MIGAGLPPFTIPHAAKDEEQQAKRQEAGEQRQAVDTFQLCIYGFTQANPVITAGVTVAADGGDCRNPDRTSGACPHPMNRASGRVSERLQAIRRGDAVCEFRRINWPHMGQCFQIAIFHPEDADLIPLQ